MGGYVGPRGPVVVPEDVLSPNVLCRADSGGSLRPHTHMAQPGGGILGGAGRKLGADDSFSFNEARDSGLFGRSWRMDGSYRLARQAPGTVRICHRVDPRSRRCAKALAGCFFLARYQARPRLEVSAALDRW